MGARFGHVPFPPVSPILRWLVRYRVVGWGDYQGAYVFQSSRLEPSPQRDGTPCHKVETKRVLQAAVRSTEVLPGGRPPQLRLARHGGGQSGECNGFGRGGGSKVVLEVSKTVVGFLDRRSSR